MGMQYIRDRYKVPAKRGGRVIYSGDGQEILGTIRSAKGGYLKIQLDDRSYTGFFHPTWKMQYLTAAKSCRNQQRVTTSPDQATA